MCRLFGMLSVRASNANKHLLEDPCSLYAQSKVDSRRLQGDGWGIGFYENGSPIIIKSEKPVYMDYENFSSSVRRAKSRIILAHIRRASNPRGLPREKMISKENSQPFTFGRYIFVHNGTITIPDEVAEALGEWRRRIRGLNDSEVYFWFIMKELADGADLPMALKNFEATLEDLWMETREKYPDKRRPYVGLNCIISEGENLYAYCRHDGEGKASKSLCFRDQPVFEMSYSLSKQRLIIASEKTNREEDWKPLRDGELLTGRIIDDEIAVEIKRVV